MKNKTNKQIAVEIEALRKLKPVGQWKNKTARSLKLAIDELNYPFDRTAGEWMELTEEQRDLCEQIAAWKEGQSEHRPSEGWGGLAE